MEELFYFPAFDLLIKIKYTKTTNSLRYSTHRPIKLEERKIIDRYILLDVGPNTDYYHRTPSLFHYKGVDRSLEKELRVYRLHDTIKNVMKRKAVVDKKVKDLISSSLSRYYFERVGDELIKLRQLLKANAEPHHIENSVENLNTLLEAYNVNAGEQIDIGHLLPKGSLTESKSS